MKVYHVLYRNDEDNTISEFFTNKIEAEKRQRQLKKIEAESDYEDDYNGVNMLYDLSNFDVEISKTGILDMLNNRFSEAF